MVKCIVDASISHVANQHGQGIRKLMLDAEIPLHHVVRFRRMFLPEGALGIDVGDACCEGPLRPGLHRYRAGVGRLQSWPVRGILRIKQ